ncbi:putative URA2-multifunctional pyrimidine biosynthesis protein [Tilletiaria anomala UBC 951]|uniref:Putative URA2-multifunctional pyrimidine biosynthesis protein n=1 Tax=Tilletiaria anomala (strain ATCC 24038 / CBS 436.72 / UBC 951) TaxID=1037660 RepID=A0A066VEC1_TILAU|nr:putative URA2-multifunctional pyrimidine biosynthesis protein [Tilletiaria anomala UBC 951]KDN40097.1 putative URA2-multifunctional pyrimidine biosynthesis protein [Tilletiaria anomala UBC 951]
MSITANAASAAASGEAAASKLQSNPSKMQSVAPEPAPCPPATLPPLAPGDAAPDAAANMVLELADGTAYRGISFGAAGKSISGECVFQTGMVGYVESLTDPSYEGQILVLTFPLVGNYGVPSREESHATIQNLLASPFESSRIHIAGLVIAYYSHDFSHWLAKSSLADWLKENGVPAIYGVDTRALTKRIRSRGSMLAKLLAMRSDSLTTAGVPAGLSNGSAAVVSSALSRPPTPPTLGLSGTPSGLAGDADAAWRLAYQDIAFADPNKENLVARVSTRQPVLYTPRNTSPGGSLGQAKEALLHPSGRPIRILALDVGMKYNQIRCFTSRGVELKVVPWNYDFLSISEEPFDGLFISNGPGDPTSCAPTIANIQKLIARKDSVKDTVPIFGICLGHQLLALASGAETEKMKFGNRGHNIPCTDRLSGRCYITSQNHGYAVKATTLKQGWEELFYNANDDSNEGIYCKDAPFFSVQFHPESTPGPRDTEFLFDVFIRSVVDCAAVKGSPAAAVLPPVQFTGGKAAENALAYPRQQVRKVLVLGSGGLSIGQAGEFDYSGSQAIKALKEEGIYSVLINPNIATIQTSAGLADKVYFLPVTPEFVLKVVKHERPDGIFVTFGGQTALNVGIKIKEELKQLGVKVLGTPIETIITTEDRDLFAKAMGEIGEKCAPSASATTWEEALTASKSIGFPVIVRAAFALGGLGSGFASNEDELRKLCTAAFANSPQVLVEKSMKGWKEVEYEVVRDGRNNCITVCNMENFDPLGIHTGDSIVIAPSQTLSDEDYNMLRTTAVNVIRHLGVVGECNIQYALNPHSKEYCIIEVNARLSRSSALASKATGYPLAFIAAKLGLGIPLNEIRNSVTRETSACFEPSLDYVVCKFPRWDLRKFVRVSSKLGSSMKSVGEVMSIGRTFEEAIQKAIRQVDYQNDGFGANDFVDDSAVDEELTNPTDKRMFAIANALRLGYSVDKIHQMTSIDRWFLSKLEKIFAASAAFSRYHASQLPPDLLRYAKQLGYSDKQLAKCIGSTELAVRRLRQEYAIMPFVKQIDTVAAEFPAYTNYLYTTYHATEHDVSFDDKGVIVLGSGVYRIGSSVEFDWCAVRAIRTLRDRGFKTVMINYNPETVSTDYDEADRLYFENISLETVLDIYDLERSSGVIISMGGQTPNNIALPLHRQNVKILGTSPEMIDMAENRYKFSRMLDKIGVDQPMWKELTSFEEAQEACARFGYPVLVRPSYVLSGAAMNVVYSPEDLNSYLSQATAVNREHPVVITKYLEGAKEIEMDAVAKDGKMMMHYISEHVENAGVHSGDATLILPPQDLDPETVRRIETATAKIAASLHVTGPFNIQFIAKNNEIKVIECNVRAARSFPFVSKVTGVDAIQMATDVMLDLPVEAYPKINLPKNYVGVKVPQFSFSRLAGADPILGVEMASTGEVACFGRDKYEAYLKAMIASGIKLPQNNVLLSIGSFSEKQELVSSVRTLHALGFTLYGSSGTADFYGEQGIPVNYLEALPEDDDVQSADNSKAAYSLLSHLSQGLSSLFISLPSKNKYRRPLSFTSMGYRARRLAIDRSIPLITNVKNAKLFVEALARHRKAGSDFLISPVDFKTSHQVHSFPGFINVNAFLPSIADPASGAREVAELTKASLAAGFTAVHLSPIGMRQAVADEQTLSIIEGKVVGSAHCDVSLALAASNSVTTDVSDFTERARSLFISPALAGKLQPAAVAANMAGWPEQRPLVTDARGNDLASILLLASLQSRSIHVTEVSSRDDIALIVLSKNKGLKVTCDVAIYSLFFTNETYPAATCLPSSDDQLALWENMDEIDILTVGSVPYKLGVQLGQHVSAASGVVESMLLLLDAVNEKKFTLDDITDKLSKKPREIFAFPEQLGSEVQVDVDRAAPVVKREVWSPLQGRATIGSISRVVAKGRPVFVDGEVLSNGTLGSNISNSFGAIQSVSKASAQARTKSISESSVRSGRRQSFNQDGARAGLLGEAPSSPNADNMGQVRSPILAGQDGPMVHIPRTNLMSVFQEDGPMPLAAPATLASPSLRTAIYHPTFNRRHVLSVRQFNRNDLHALFSVAQEMRLQVERQGTLDILKGRVLCNLFYEESTRTSCSFEAAMVRCGGQVVSVKAQSSSVVKGESLADTIRTLGCYNDAIVLRHPAVGSAQQAAKFSPVPVINAGDGIGEHPTQALLDIFTIREELGTVSGLTVTLLGDLKNGRTTHSLVKLLCLYGVTLNYVSPASLCMPDDVKAEVAKRGIAQFETSDLDTVIARTDVLYVTRVQKERFPTPEAYEAVKNAYVVNNDVLAKAKQDMIVMHPLPRVNEIDAEVDFDIKRAAYFRQMRYGLFVRMALLAMVLHTG